MCGERMRPSPGARLQWRGEKDGAGEQSGMELASLILRRSLGAIGTGRDGHARDRPQRHRLELLLGRGRRDVRERSREIRRLDLLRIEGPDDARLPEPQGRDDVGIRTARHLIQVLACRRDYLAGRYRLGKLPITAGAG